MRVLLERVGGMVRTVMEQQSGADQATTALQALQQQQQQSATAAQHAQRRAAQAADIGALTQGCWAKRRVGDRSSSSS